MRLEWVRDAVRQAVGFDPYPGTLNLRLVDGDMRRRWREVRTRAALRLAPPPPAQCGGRLIPIVVMPDIPGCVIVPDITRYGDDVLEVVASVHLRSRLRLQDDDPLTLRVDAGKELYGGNVLAQLQSVAVETRGTP
jgi:riboflavin kinase